jgi:hypothetical protein
MWTEITRAQYRRDELGYASDLRAAEWEQIAPCTPPIRRPVVGPKFTNSRRSAATGIILFNDRGGSAIWGPLVERYLATRPAQ